MRRVLRILPVLSFAVLCAMASGAPSARAAQVWAVTKTADTADGACDADCSLREAVIAANASPGTDVVTIPAGLYVLGGAGGEDLAASGDLDLRDSVTILGAGIDATVVDGGGADRVVDVVESAVVTIRDLTLRNGRVPDGDTQGGGGILWGEPFSGKTLDLTLERVAIVGNDAGDGDGGGMRIDQEDPGSAVVRIVESTIADNTMADGDGGGLHLCCENLTVTIESSAITGNTAVEDPGRPGTNGEGGGIYHCCTDTTLAIFDSTLAGNHGPTQGGGLYTCCGVEANTSTLVQRSAVYDNDALGAGPRQGFGGGIEAEGATTVVNSTLSGNRALRDGGGIASEDVLLLRNVTVAGNEAGRVGGGVFENGFGVTLANTLLAGNRAAGAAADCGAAAGSVPFTSLGGNLASDASCGLAGPGDQQGVDPMLDPLGDHGGPTATHALAAGSPAIDAAGNAECTFQDQRRQPRPADGNGDGNAVCDVGAFERGAVGEDCDNGVDDDGDGLVDCADFACAGESTCPEACANCVDDDGDGLVDRDDLDDCPAPADGAGAGVGDPARAKRVVVCAAALRTSGAKLAATHVKALHTCLATLTACVQRKPGDGRCLARGADTCRRGLAAVEKTVAKAGTAIGKACGVLSSDELADPAGLGFGAEPAACTTPADAPAVAACLAAEHACIAQRLVGIATPRARELLTLAGLDDAVVVPCAYAPADGGGAGLGTHGKAAAACLATIQKAGAAFVHGTAKLGHACAQAVFACQQRTPGAARCLAKARATCAKAFAKIPRLEERLAAAIDRTCNREAPSLAELLGTTGAGFQTQAALCRALGVPALDAVGALATCVTRQHRCQVVERLTRELPRVRELLATGGVAFP